MLLKLEWNRPLKKNKQFYLQVVGLIYGVDQDILTVRLQP